MNETPNSGDAVYLQVKFTAEAEVTRAKAESESVADEGDSK